MMENMLRFIVALFISVSCVQCMCHLNVKSNLSEEVPIFIQNNEFIYPNYFGFISIRENTNFTLLCNGYLNSIEIGIHCSEYPKALDCYDVYKVIEISCHSKKFYFGEHEIRNFQNVVCLRPNFANVLETDNLCADGLGKLINIGYILKAKLIKLYEVCYDKYLSRTLYTKHNLIGRSLGTTQTPDYVCTQYKKNSYSYEIPIGAVYQIENQRLQLAKAFNIENFKFQMNYSTVLTKSRLVPRRDFVFTSWQDSTAFLINTMPQWKTLSQSRWEDIEVQIRLMAIKTLLNFTIYTGTHGVMAVKGNDGIERELYLGFSEKLPVPKYFWKIIQHQNKGILLVILNDPFDTKPIEFCKSQCKEYCWHLANYTIPETGPTWCCNVTKEKLKELHLPELNITDVLVNHECRTTNNFS